MSSEDFCCISGGGGVCSVCLFFWGGGVGGVCLSVVFWFWEDCFFVWLWGWIFMFRFLGGGYFVVRACACVCVCVCVEAFFPPNTFYFKLPAFKYPVPVCDSWEN